MIPLTILWVGIGLGAKAMIIFFAAFVPCVLNSYTGIKSTNPTLIAVAKTFGATNFQIFRKVASLCHAHGLSPAIRIALGIPGHPGRGGAARGERGPRLHDFDGTPVRAAGHHHPGMITIGVLGSFSPGSS